MTPAQTLVAPYLKRWLPIVALLAGIVAFYLSGLHRHLSFAAFVEHGAAIEAFAQGHLAVAVLLFMLLYVAMVALSLPGAAVMSVVGGFLFGWMISVPATVVAATLGSIVVFQAVKTSFGAAMAERAGPLARKLADGFACDCFNYLIFLRLVPVFPFFAVNAVAGICRIPLRSFVAATFIGIIPGSLAFAYLGTGLGSIIDAQKLAHAECIAAQGPALCPFELQPHRLITAEIVIAFCILGVVALLPVIVRWWRRKPQ